MPLPDQHATTDQLRHDIDRGRTGDKVDFPDPAAAPLGTDEEAAGSSPGAETVHRAREREKGRFGNETRAQWTVWTAGVIVLLVLAAVAWMIW
ncbi:MAG TPA: hypothetical protein VGF59_25750 [Bryobacteraceae bacterium]|jgi:hypothetical protein